MARGIAVDTVLQATGSTALRIAIDQDGWLFIGYGFDRAARDWEDGGSREYLEPSDALAWVEEARQLLESATQAGLEWPGGATRLLGPREGRRLRFGVQVLAEYERLNFHFTTYHCHGSRYYSSGSSVSEESARALLGTLELAARRGLEASRGRASAPLRTDTVFWSHAVSCPARGDTTNVTPTSPAARPEGTPLAVQFVVDTLGRVESSTLEVLSDPAPALVQAVREAAASWRYTPALRGGRRVRQVTQGTVLVMPRPAPRDSSPQTYAEPAGAGIVSVLGLVHFFGIGRYDHRTQVHGIATPPLPEFYPASALLEWADSVERLLERRPLGKEADDGIEDPTVGYPMAFDSVARFYEPHEVPCPATPLRELRPLLDAEALRETMEVLFEFVVDSAGHAVPQTLAVPRGTPPNIVQALRSTLAETRFFPALRAGRRVNQRVSSRIVLEPRRAERPPPTDSLSACLRWGARVTRLTAAIEDGANPPATDLNLERLIRELVMNAEPADRTPYGRVSIGIGGDAPTSITLRFYGVEPAQEIQIYRWTRDSLRSFGPMQTGPPATVTLSFEHDCVHFHD
jgi:TonB family protein